MSIIQSFKQTPQYSHLLKPPKRIFNILTFILKRSQQLLLSSNRIIRTIQRLSKTLWLTASIWPKLNDSPKLGKNLLDMEEQNLNALEFPKFLLLTLPKESSKRLQPHELDLHQKGTKSYLTLAVSRTFWFKVFPRQKLESQSKRKSQRNQKQNSKIRNLGTLNQI